MIAYTDSQDPRILDSISLSEMRIQMYTDNAKIDPNSIYRTVGAYNHQKSKIIQTLTPTCTNEILFGQVLGKLLLTYWEKKKTTSQKFDRNKLR